jgi:hypothetical protein
MAITIYSFYRSQIPLKMLFWILKSQYCTNKQWSEINPNGVGIVKRKSVFKGIVSRDFGTFLISLDRNEVYNRAGSGCRMFILLGITSSVMRNPPEDWDSAGNFLLIYADSDRKDQNARKIL